ncbi:MAG TPA: hypothetical protein VM120_03640 [Bryobacteraceae bacterium]|nr:hypothetical protein [Bryobacteraceae bacterium]
MKRRAFLAWTAAAPVWARWENSPTVKAGFAETDITPEIGMEQPGGYGKSFHRTFHDACKARAAVFDDGKKRVAIVGLDALIVPRGLVLEVRKEIAAKCGIPGESVLINASHSHSSGPIGMVQPGEFDGAPEMVKKLAYEKSSCADPKFLKKVHAAIVTAVCQADGSKADLVCGVGSGTEEKAAYNRRVRMTNGRTFTHPGQLNPDMIKYAGPVDPEVGVVGAWDRKGQLMGCIVNYACHATTSPGGISANWIYYLEKAIRGFFGEKVTVVFVQGASGDITQVDNFNQTQQPGAEEWAQIVGGRVGAETIRVLLSMPRGALTPVDAAVTVLKIPRRKPAPEKVRLATEMVAKEPAAVGVTEWTFAKETVMLDYLIRREPVADVEVQTIQIGPAVFVSNPAEYFVEFGLEIKAKSRFPYTFPAELSNGCVGYVPTEEALGESGGGYETRLTYYSNLIPAAGRQIAAAGIALANKMTPGAVPSAPKAVPTRGAWQYGNVPAEVK